MKNLFGRLIGFLSPLWSWANFQVNKNVHTAVKVVQIIKDIIQSPVLDILLAVEQRIAPDPNVVKKYDKIKAIVEEWETERVQSMYGLIRQRIVLSERNREHSIYSNSR